MALEQAVSRARSTGSAERTVHLIDVENLTGTPQFTHVEALRLRHAYERVAPFGSPNQLVLSTSHRAAVATWFAWPAAARRLVRSGRDGADLALLDVVEHEAIASRFERVVLGSGDGIFAVQAAILQAAGCQVTVVTRVGALSRQLRLAVRDVRYIETAPLAPTVATHLRAA